MRGQANKAILENGRLQRNLRKMMTDAERVLWQMLRSRQMAGYKFRRQHPFDDFILDFVCMEMKLVVEVDGGQHGEQIEADAARTDKLARAGFRVLRFWNHWCPVKLSIDSVKPCIYTGYRANILVPI